MQKRNLLEMTVLYSKLIEIYVKLFSGKISIPGLQNVR